MKDTKRGQIYKLYRTFKSWQ